MPSSFDAKHAAEQASVCARFDSAFAPVDPDLKVGVALETLERMPITGVRIAPENGTNGWYLWGGDSSDSPDFFKPVHAQHLIEILPLVVKYLALEPGFKFMVDHEGYEDVWREDMPVEEGAS